MAQQWQATTWGSFEDWELVDIDVPEPGHGEVTIRVGAAGINPADYKHVAEPRPGVELPVPIGYEVAGVISAVGPDTEIVTGPVSVGDAVLAFRVQGGYASELTVSAQKVLHKPTQIPDAPAANLLLAGTTASQMLHDVDASRDETILLHGASGAVGVSVLQQAALLGVRVIGTASPERFAVVEYFGGIPVEYGPGLEERVRHRAPEGIAAALDAVGTEEAIEVSLALVSDPSRIVTIAGFARAEGSGIRMIAGSQPESAKYRDAVRPHLVSLADEGRLEVPIAGIYPLQDAKEALRLLVTGHPGGKLALVP